LSANINLHKEFISKIEEFGVSFMNNLCAFYATLTPLVIESVVPYVCREGVGSKNMLIAQQVICIQSHVYDLFTNFLVTFYEE